METQQSPGNHLDMNLSQSVPCACTVTSDRNIWQQVDSIFSCNKEQLLLTVRHNDCKRSKPLVRRVWCNLYIARQPCQNTLKFFMNSVSTPVTALQKRKHQDHIEALGISTLPLCVVDQQPTFSSASLCQTTYGKPHAKDKLSFHNNLHSETTKPTVQWWKISTSKQQSVVIRENMFWSKVAHHQSSMFLCVVTMTKATATVTAISDIRSLSCHYN